MSTCDAKQTPNGTIGQLIPCLSSLRMDLSVFMSRASRILVDDGPPHLPPPLKLQTVRMFTGDSYSVFQRLSRHTACDFCKNVMTVLSYDKGVPMTHTSCSPAPRIPLPGGWAGDGGAGLLLRVGSITEGSRRATPHSVVKRHKLGISAFCLQPISYDDRFGTFTYPWVLGQMLG